MSLPLLPFCPKLRLCKIIPRDTKKRRDIVPRAERHDSQAEGKRLAGIHNYLGAPMGQILSCSFERKSEASMVYWWRLEMKDRIDIS
jgi:hypothetical protein